MPRFDWETRDNVNVEELVDDFIASHNNSENPVITPGPKQGYRQRTEIKLFEQCFNLEETTRNKSG